MIIHIASLFLLTVISTNAELEEVAGWRFATFAPPPGYPGASPFGYPIYSPNTVFTGLQATEDKLFLSMPRFQPGQPITLGWVPRPQPGGRLPLDIPITPFPDWEWHRAAANGAAGASSNCSALVSVFRTRVDRCGRLWVLDSGVSDTLTTFSVSCLPKLLAFNQTTGEVLRRIEFRPEVLRLNSLLTNMVLDSRSPPGSSCLDPDDLFIYIADTTAPGIVVYDVRRDAAWRYSSPQMFPDPDKGIFKVAGESFMLMDGIIGLALSNPVLLPTYRPDTLYSERLLYFQAFASDRIYSVPTSALQAQPKENEDLPIKLVGHKSSQAAPLAVDPKDDALIFSPVSETAIASWQPAQNILGVKAYNPNLLQFVLDLNIEPEQIWAISTRFQKFFRKTVKAEEVNLRILRIENSPRYHFH